MDVIIIAQRWTGDTALSKSNNYFSPLFYLFWTWPDDILSIDIGAIGIYSNSVKMVAAPVAMKDTNPVTHAIFSVYIKPWPIIDQN